MLWAAANCVYVYLVRDGVGVYRIESAVLIFAAIAAPGISATPSARRTAAGERELWLVALPGLLTVAWLALFLTLLRFPFLSDDYVFLSAYRSVADVTRPFQFYRPGFALLFVLLRRLGGGSPGAFHAAGFAMHLASSALVYQLALRVLGRKELATTAFAVFLFNPLQLEAVLWVSGLQELLWTLFALAALLYYSAQRDLSAARLFTVAVLVACALSVKETAVGFVLLAATVDATLFGFRRGRMIWAAYSVFALELAAYLVLRQRAIGLEQSFFVLPSRYFLKQLIVLPYEYFVHPWNSVAVHVPVFVLCVSALGILGLLFVAVRRGLPVRSLLGPGIILASTLPVYSFFYVAPDLAGARYVYFAGAGFALLLADLLGASVTAQRPAAACGLAIGCVLAVSLALNLRPWRTAGDLVDAMARALRQGRPVSDVVLEWQVDRGITLDLRNGIPRSHAGVWLFANGYDEFVRLTLTN